MRCSHIEENDNDTLRKAGYFWRNDVIGEIPAGEITLSDGNPFKKAERNVIRKAWHQQETVTFWVYTRWPHQETVFCKREMKCIHI